MSSGQPQSTASSWARTVAVRSWTSTGRRWRSPATSRWARELLGSHVGVDADADDRDAAIGAGAYSERMPHTLAPSINTSLGHLRTAATPMASTARATATPASSDIQPSRSACGPTATAGDRHRRPGRRGPAAVPPPATGLVSGDAHHAGHLGRTFGGRAGHQVGVGRHGGLDHFDGVPAARLRQAVGKVLGVGREAHGCRAYRSRRPSVPVPDRALGNMRRISHWE